MNCCVAIACRAGVMLCLTVFAGYGQQASCSSHLPANSPKNFANKNVFEANFSRQDLTGADFSQATVRSSSFIGANLTNANFSGATFQTDPNGAYPNSDFTLANLTGACFASASFSTKIDFTYSTLTCADFSNTNISTNGLLGPGTLEIDTSVTTCRSSFQNVKMNCQFIDSWHLLDLSSADISACTQGSELSMRDFTGTKMTNVNFAKTDLRGSKFSSADLSGAQLQNTQLDGTHFRQAILNKTRFEDASITEADFTSAQLFGAVFDRANLTHSVLYGAELSDNSSGHIAYSATFVGAHLKDVNLSNAKLAGVSFTNANFYSSGSTQSYSCTTAEGNYQGFTKNCASAHGADITDADFSSAYLAGLDLSGAKGGGARFSDAILVGANLGAIQLSADGNGAHSVFTQALLQGSYFTGDSAKLSGDVQFNDAFFDFNPNGNSLYILLDGQKHNNFRCSLCDRSDICVNPSYGSNFGVTGSSDITCPNGTPGPCGKARGGLQSPWRSPIDLRNGWYTSDSTFIPASTPSSSCKTNPQPPNQFW